VNGVSNTTFKLTPQGSGTAVGAAVSYDAATKKATLVPTSALSANTTYTAQLTSGIADLAGNALAAVNWNFTTASSAPGGTTLTFTPVADTFVNQSSPSTASGSSTSFSIVGGASSARIAYIRFNVTGLPAGAVVQSANLRLFVTNDSTGGGVFNSITNNTWAETINWNTRPAIDGPQVASLGAVATNATVEVNLTAAITGNGTYSFAITLPNTNTNTVGYASKEQTTTTRRPQLIVTTQ
jgi:acid phosphatase type 7